MSLKRSLIGGSAILAVIARSPRGRQRRSSARSPSRPPARRRAGSVPHRRQGAAQLPVRRGGRGLPRAQKADPAFAHGLLGRGDEPQPPAVGAAGRRGGEAGARQARPDADGARRQGEAAEGEGVLRGAAHALLLAGRQAGARPGLLGGHGAHVRAVARRSRDGDLLRAVAARHGPARRHRASAARRSPRRSRRRCSQRTRSIRARAHFIIHAFDDPDHAPLGLERGRRLREDRALGRARAAHAVAHLRAARDVAEDGGVQRRRLQGRRRSQHAHEARRGPRGLPHAVVARLRQPDARPVRRGEEERRAGEGRPPTATPATRGVRNGYLGMRARYISDTAQWEKLTLDAPARAAPAATTRTCPGMPGMAAASGSAHLDLHRRRERGEDWATWRRPKHAEAALRAAREKTAGRPNALRGQAARRSARRSWAPSSAGPRGRRTRRCSSPRKPPTSSAALAAPSGPPEPIKPAFELYGEMLLEAGSRERGDAGVRAVAAPDAEAHAVGPRHGPCGGRGGRPGDRPRPISGVDDHAWSGGLVAGGPGSTEGVEDH